MTSLAPFGKLCNGDSASSHWKEAWRRSQMVQGWEKPEGKLWLIITAPGIRVSCVPTTRQAHRHPCLCGVNILLGETDHKKRKLVKYRAC